MTTTSTVRTIGLISDDADLVGEILEEMRTAAAGKGATGGRGEPFEFATQFSDVPWRTLRVVPTTPATAAADGLDAAILLERAAGPAGRASLEAVAAAGVPYALSLIHAEWTGTSDGGRARVCEIAEARLPEPVPSERDVLPIPGVLAGDQVLQAVRQLETAMGRRDLEGRRLSGRGYHPAIPPGVD